MSTPSLEEPVASVLLSELPRRAILARRYLWPSASIWDRNGSWNASLKIGRGESSVRDCRSLGRAGGRLSLPIWAHLSVYRKQRLCGELWLGFGGMPGEAFRIPPARKGVTRYRAKLDCGALRGRRDSARLYSMDAVTAATQVAVAETRHARIQTQEDRARWALLHPVALEERSRALFSARAFLNASSGASDLSRELLWWPEEIEFLRRTFR